MTALVKRLTRRITRFSGRAVDALTGTRDELWRLVLVVGVISGLTGALYIAALKLMTRVLGAGSWSDRSHLVVLVLIGGAIGLLTLVLGSPGDVELLVDNIHVNGGRSDIRELRSLIPVSLLGIASGSSIGPEAPLVQSTGGLGNWTAMRRRLGVADSRVLTITGMAAGFAVLFGAPLGSAIFALEILHRRGLEYYEALLPAGIGALTGYALYISLNRVGFQPVWTFPVPHDLQPVDLLVGLAAGVVGAVVATAFTYLSRFERELFRHLPAAVRPVVGGLALGGLAFLSPYALTFGEGQIQHVATSRIAIATLLFAALIKLVSSSTILSAGWRGGFIIPLFFMGAVLGSAGAQAFHVDAIVAMTATMAACNVGVTKTPLGSALVVAEMAGLRLLPSTFLASVVALFLTSRVSMIEAQRTREGAFDKAVIDRDAQVETLDPESDGDGTGDGTGERGGERDGGRDVSRGSSHPIAGPAAPGHASPGRRPPARRDAPDHGGATAKHPAEGSRG